MILSSRFVGTRFKEYETEITWRRSMNYAAAAQDTNPRYFDDESHEGIAVPSMLSVAVTWPISERIWEYMGPVGFPAEILATQVHYTEHLTFHRPMRPGDRLVVQGSIAAIVPHTAGTVVVVRYEARDGSGQPVFTEHMGGVMRGVQCEDQGRGAETLPKVPSWKCEDSPIWECSLHVDELAPYIYDGCTNIFFPIHTSASFARAVGLPRIILQGTASLAYCVRELINREAQGDPVVLKSLDCRFTGMVFPGTEVRLRLLGRVTDNEGTDLFYSLVNAQGIKAISNGYARLVSAANR